MAATRGHRLQLESITQRFGDFVAVENIDLDVSGGEIVALLGPSGCGKSTLLRIVSGFIRQSQGRVLFDGAAVDHLSPRERGVGIVFQNYALFPHMTVAENVAYGLEGRGLSSQRIRTRVEEALHLVELTGFEQRYRHELSGGQQQRVALARALAVQPELVLLDEPFSALDAALRASLRQEVARMAAFPVPTPPRRRWQEPARRPTRSTPPEGRPPRPRAPPRTGRGNRAWPPRPGHGAGGGRHPQDRRRRSTTNAR